MSTRPFVNDALWRTLCPRFHVNARSSKPRNTGVAAVLQNRPRLRPCSEPAACRVYHTSIARSLHNDTLAPKIERPTYFALQKPPDVGVQRNGRSKIPLAQLPTHILYEHLRDAGTKGHSDEILNICRVLIKDRGEQPNKDMYNAVLHSCVSVKDGSAGKVRKVLEEMGFWEDGESMALCNWKVELDERGCECVLEALAVHPDYLLRAEILEYMKARWFILSDRGRNFVVAGIVRDRLFEQAVESLEQMVSKKIRVEDWLFDMTLWTLLEYGEVEDAFYVLNLKEAAWRQGNRTRGMELSSALWSSLLDAAAQKQLHEASSMVWNSQVQPGYLKPATGTCLHVLTLASRHGDVHLATDVFRVLTDRGTTFESHHYELLIATYLNADDLPAALSVILIMVDANLRVESGTCQPLYWYLCREKEGDESKPMEAFSLLQEYEASGRKVPTAAINACLQASINLNRFDEAIEFYKALHTVSPAGPNTQTFNILFRGCHVYKRKELAMFFANEMIQLGLKPDRITYDRLILVCLQAGDVEDAVLYYEEMRTIKRSRGNLSEVLQPRRGTWEMLIGRLVNAGDDRAVALLKDYERETSQPRQSVGTAVRSRFDEAVSPPVSNGDVSDVQRSKDEA